MNLYWTLTLGLLLGNIFLNPAHAALDENASYLEKIIQDRHIKHGFVRERTRKFLHSSDNDGLWTSLYVAAMSFKCGATKEKLARDWARKSFRALEWLESITGIPGFPARSIVKAGDPKKYGYDGEWHLDSSRKWEWKGNTSSDEIAGHFFAYSIFYDLAADKTDKERVRKLTRKVMDHIIDHDWRLVDKDGQPTLWGVWNPEQINDHKPLESSADINWKEEQALSSLEILSHLKTAYHITGDKKYQKEYLNLIHKHGYAQNTLGRVIDPQDINYSDVELAFCAYYPLLKYEQDIELYHIYLKSLRKTWTIVRPAAGPWWNFTQCIFNWGEDCDTKDALNTLKKMPRDQINKGSVLLRWNSNPFLPNPGNGEIEGDGVVFLLPYWMGKYHKIFFI